VTVVPGESGTATLICDQCGGEDCAAGVTNDSDLVWPFVSGLGWTGSPFATGTHRCPRCSISAALQPAPSGGADSARTYGASYDLRTRSDVDAVVITPLSDMDAGLVERLRDDVMRAAHAHAHIVVDLHAVEFIDSAGLGLLVRARQEAKQHDATFTLAAPSRFVLTVLHTMRLDGVFRSFPNHRAALAAIQASDAATAHTPPGAGPRSRRGAHLTPPRRGRPPV
jgi:anti-sigma B factor antagonist